ncbi:MAG: response regulator [Deltaproteobacteria bacterium]|nr:response regulator [Deltaproteobacteria bacterium]
MEILIVDNNSASASSIEGTIVRLGHEVHAVGSCGAALEVMGWRGFDLVMLDVFLPDGRGDRLIPRLRELRPGVGIIVMTGYNSRRLEREVRERGVLYYMVKPFDLGYLEELLCHLSRKYDQRAGREPGKEVSGRWRN